MTEYNTSKLKLGRLGEQLGGQRQSPPPTTAAATATATSTLDHPEAIRNVPVYLPAPLRQRLRDEAYRQSVTMTDVVINAFELHGANYPELTQARPRTPGGPPRRYSGRNRDSVQVQLRLTGEQAQWLDDTVAHNAPTRSALVTALLVRHLNPS